MRRAFTAAVVRGVGGTSRLLGRGDGAVVGGRVALALDPRALGRLAVGRAVLIVSAVNGKTTTTRMLRKALETSGPVASNDTGANMDTGVVSALARDPAPTAVLEVDELWVPAVATQTDPVVLIFGNLSRDQLDRVGEVSRICARWRAAVQSEPAATVVANCDDPYVTWAAMPAAERGGRAVWVSAGQWWIDDATLCPNCGAVLARSSDDWSCAQCGLRRPVPAWSIDGDELRTPDGDRLALNLSLPGRANRANAALAIAAAVAHGIDVTVALAAVGAVDEVDGRYATHVIGSHEVDVLLAKNPAGWLEIFDMIESAHGPGASVILASNGRAADGRDLSWLYDAPFERLAGRTVACIGERRVDMAVRLMVAGANPILADSVSEALAGVPAGSVTVAASYTAFRDLSEELGRLARGSVQAARSGARP